jgi:hypothetical protein
MAWNWEHPDWPNFTYDSAALEPLERQFLLQSGEFIGAHKHVGPHDQQTLRLELISEEAVRTSAIEGEILNRDSVQSSLRQQLGLGVEQPGVKPAERGISQLMVSLYDGFAAPLDEETSETHRSRVSAATALTPSPCRSSRDRITNTKCTSRRRRQPACRGR